MGLATTEVPSLEDWITLTEAADMLGLTRQGVHRRAETVGFSTLHKLGTRNLYVVRAAEIQALVDERDHVQSALLEAEVTASK